MSGKSAQLLFVRVRPRFYVVPQFAFGFERVARWDRFSRPDPLPKYGVTGFPSLWWYDTDKADKLKRA